jgi:hypothetical protein
LSSSEETSSSPEDDSSVSIEDITKGSYSCLNTAGQPHTNTYQLHPVHPVTTQFTQYQEVVQELSSGTPSE